MNNLCIRRLDQTPDLLRLQQAQPHAYPFMLDSAGGPASLTRYSILLRVDPHTPPLLATDHNNQDFFERLDQDYAALRCEPNPDQSLPFSGGWFLYLGYEMAAAVEPGLRLPAAEDQLPMAGAWRCPAALIIDHHNAAAWAVAEHDWQLQQVLEDVAAIPPAHAHTSALPVLSLSEEPPYRYEAAVSRIKDYILAGDVFQVNLSRAWHGSSPQPLDPHYLYRRLRQANPAPFASLCRIDDYWILSSSPERLVQQQGDLVQTRPIAGTRPRSPQQAADEALGKELLLHPKERAEHVMLIDLERNDLGRVCVPGSVEVSELMVLESHAHVHHIVSNVRGRLRPGTSPGAVLKAVFPGGTITGCPKVRCMEIIAELEQIGRGCYTGSLGYLSRDGQMDSNILIRTLLLRGHELLFRTGAGIVADSDASREVDETVAKAHGLRLALSGDADAQPARRSAVVE